MACEGGGVGGDGSHPAASRQPWGLTQQAAALHPASVSRKSHAGFKRLCDMELESALTVTELGNGGTFRNARRGGPAPLGLGHPGKRGETQGQETVKPSATNFIYS